MKQNANSLRLTIQYILANHCMPTLFHWKPSNLVNVDRIYFNDEKLFFMILSKELERFSCRYFIVYKDEGSILLLIYYYDLLKEIIGKKDVENILKSYGYGINHRSILKGIEGEGELDSVFCCLEHLRMRYANYRKTRDGFPHEIGLILGYPIEDVKDFIKYKGKKYLCNGFWKVYHEPDKAKQLFSAFQNLRELALRNVLSGNGLEFLDF